jgi:hypothetical protein
MKNNIKILALALAAFTMSACMDDLNRVPLNESDFTADKAYDNTRESYARGLAKIYGGFALVGQDGAGSSDISVSDAGASELTRAWWSIQELSTDAGKVAWVDDPWTREINFNTWGTMENDALAAIYERTIITVTIVNEFLRQTTDDKLSSRGVGDALRTTIQRYRAEAKYIRAYCYWMMMDAFGNPPFTTDADPLSDAKPGQIKRADLFDWIENELKALTTSNDMPAIGTATYPQVDKGAVWGLLARIYLNAKVYRGTERWADAKTAAANVIGGPYALAPVYAELFMADNGENVNTKKELIFAVQYDLESIQSWGGTTFLVNSSLAKGEEGTFTNGSKAWGGPRTTFEYAQKHFAVANANYVTGTFDCPDKRAMFFIKDRKESMDDTGVFTQGWSVVKYSRYPSGTVLNDPANPPVAPAGDHSSGDFPMMRLAEIYLIHAEASLRAGTLDATSLGYLNALRVRAGLPGNLTAADVDLQYILDERARELMWEGHRRTDLIRYELYTGGAYLWPWKGGVKAGRAIDAHYNLCPLLQKDVNLNANLTQNPGYVK